MTTSGFRGICGPAGRAGTDGCSLWVMSQSGKSHVSYTRVAKFEYGNKTKIKKYINKILNKMKISSNIRLDDGDAPKKMATSHQLNRRRWLKFKPPSDPHPSPEAPLSLSFHDSTEVEADAASLWLVGSRGPRVAMDDEDDDAAATDGGDRMVAVRVARRAMPR